MLIAWTRRVGAAALVAIACLTLRASPARAQVEEQEGEDSDCRQCVVAGCLDWYGPQGEETHRAGESVRPGYAGWQLSHSICMYFEGVYELSCQQHHGCYGESENDMAYALAAGDATALFRLLSMPGARATLNHARQAVQLVGCSPGTIRLHIQLASDTYERLVAMQRNISVREADPSGA